MAAVCWVPPRFYSIWNPLPCGDTRWWTANKKSFSNVFHANYEIFRIRFQMSKHICYNFKTSKEKEDNLFEPLLFVYAKAQPKWTDRDNFSYMFCFNQLFNDKILHVWKHFEQWDWIGLTYMHFWSMLRSNMSKRKKKKLAYNYEKLWALPSNGHIRTRRCIENDRQAYLVFRLPRSCSCIIVNS